MVLMTLAAMFNEPEKALALVVKQPEFWLIVLSVVFALLIQYTLA
jgi:hypothetical protein